MAVSTTIDTALGVVSTVVDSAATVAINGAIAVNQNASNTGFSPYSLTARNKSDSATLTLLDAGLVTVSKGSAATIVMPLASAVPGAMFVVRTTTAAPHVLTGSQETNGTLVFSNGTNNGSRATLTGVIGSSVSLLSDGKNFLVLGNSGSVTIAGT